MQILARYVALSRWTFLYRISIGFLPFMPCGPYTIFHNPGSFP